MSLSLREQLLQAGLVTKKQVEKAEQQARAPQPKHQQHKKKESQPDPRALAAQKAQAEKAARDQELNRKKQEKAERNARWAQIRQLVAEHRIVRAEECELIFNFVDNNAVKRIYVTATLRDQITRGTLAIVRCDGKYELVPTAIGDRIREREIKAVVNMSAESQAAPAEDDPYAEHKVPDDLMW
jgi:uncharacterized protein YaiL (DUF2058 family)